MGTKKCVHWEVVNAKPYPFGTLCFSTPQPNMDFSLNDIAIKVPRCTKHEIKMYNFFRFLVFFFNILFFPSIICVDKQDCVYKLSKQKHGISVRRNHYRFIKV